MIVTGLFDNDVVVSLFRETFRKFFGQPNAKNTFVNVSVGVVN